MAVSTEAFQHLIGTRPSQDFLLAFSPSSAFFKTSISFCATPRTRSRIRPILEKGSASGREQENLESMQENPVENLKGKDPDWDPYLGWDVSDESSAENSNIKMIGCARTAGIVILAIGFALGGCFIHAHNKGSIWKLPVYCPVKKQALPSTPSSGSQLMDDSYDKRFGVVTKDIQKEASEKVHTRGYHRQRMGRILVPTSVDHAQEQVFKALQALKVIEMGTEPGDICSRREYARWLISSSSILSRTPAHKVFPAMYIEASTNLAFQDVLPDDPDFPFIQGLAEAGLIPSRLLVEERGGRKRTLDEKNNHIFFPDSFLTRQDLISWKVAFDRKSIPASVVIGDIEKKGMSAFTDFHKIEHDIRPTIFVDLLDGERSMTSLAFGYTRRFQPEKLVTKAQAAITTAAGEAWDLVSEELARLEAESLAEAAVAAELALESRALQDAAAVFNRILQVEREKREATTMLLKKACVEVEKVKAEWEGEKASLLREREAMDLEKELVSKLRHDVEKRAHVLSSLKFEVALKKEHIERLHVEAEQEKEAINKIQLELKIEKDALLSAWGCAEEASRRAFAHAKCLQQARKRWECQGVCVRVSKDLDENNIPGPSWHYSEGYLDQRSPFQSQMLKFKSLSKVIFSIWLACLRLIGMVKEETYHLMAEPKRGLAEASTNVIERIHESLPSPSAVSGVASGLRGGVLGLREGTTKTASEWKGGAKRFIQTVNANVRNVCNLGSKSL